MDGLEAARIIWRDDELTDIKIMKMNIDNSPNTPTTLGVRGIPTLIIFKDGKPEKQ